MTQPSFTQVTFRSRNDNGSETTATWRQTQGTDDTYTTDTNYRIRFLIDETASRAWSNVTWNLYYSLNSGTYTAVGSGQPVKLSLSGNFTNGDNCTSQLTGGSGSFLTSNAGMCESSGATNTGAAGNYFEVEFCIQIDSAYVAHNDTINLRVYNGTSAIATYTDTPIITVSEPPTILVKTATLTTALQPISLIKGAVTKTMATAVLSTACQALSVTTSPPPTSISIKTALMLLSTPTLVVTAPAPININAKTAALLLSAPTITVISISTPQTIVTATALIVSSGIALNPTLYQYLYAVSDSSLGSWKDQSGGTTNIYTAIDEETPSDSDYVKSPDLPAANTYRFKIGNASDPSNHTNHKISFRLRKPFAVGTLNLTVRVMEGVTQRASWTHSVTTDWTTVVKEMSEAEAASITDYTNLFIELEAA